MGPVTSPAISNIPPSSSKLQTLTWHAPYHTILAPFLDKNSKNQCAHFHLRFLLSIWYRYFFRFHLFDPKPISAGNPTRPIWHETQTPGLLETAVSRHGVATIRLLLVPLHQSFDSFREYVCILQRGVVRLHPRKSGRSSSIGHEHFDGLVLAAGLLLLARRLTWKGNKRQREEANDP